MGAGAAGAFTAAASGALSAAVGTEARTLPRMAWLPPHPDRAEAITLAVTPEGIEDESQLAALKQTGHLGALVPAHGEPLIRCHRDECGFKGGDELVLAVPVGQMDPQEAGGEVLELTEALSRAEVGRLPGHYFAGDPATTGSGVLAGRRETTWVTGMAG